MKKNYLKILKSNIGFDCPDLWIQYATKNNFTKVKGEKILSCPDCNDGKTIKIGQYIYYSTLIKLLECQNCGLIYSDVRLDASIIETHFEHAYKDENYFVILRKKIFRQILNIQNEIVPNCGRIVDIGGAKGHLLKYIRDVRPDYELLLCDCSKTACNYAEKQFNLNTICCTINELSLKNLLFDLILFIDVLYYEKDIKKVWEIFSIFSKNKSTVIIRIPNQLWLIKLKSKIKNFMLSENRKKIIDKINNFNPEHIYIFSNKYILKRLRECGFSRIEILPSECLSPQNKMKSFIMNLYFTFSKLVYFLSLRKIIITPAKLLVIR